MDLTPSFRRHALVLVVLVALMSLGTPAQATGPIPTLLAWHETAVNLPPDTYSLTFVPGQPDLLLGGDTLAYNVRSGTQTVVSTYRLLPTPPSAKPGTRNSALYGRDSDEQIWRFTLADGVGQRTAHYPTHRSLADNRAIYSLEFQTQDEIRGYVLWASSDDGLSWEARSVPHGSYLQDLTVAPQNSSWLDAVMLTVVDRGERDPAMNAPIRTVEFDLYHSDDTGRTWQRRGHLYSYTTIGTPTVNAQLNALAGAGPGVLVADYDHGLPGSSNSWTILLSVDGGRTFREVGTGGIGGATMLRAVAGEVWRLRTWITASGRLTRSADGGATWLPVTGPPVYPRSMRYSSGELVGLYSFPASPRSLLLIDDGHWYSADAGVSWQLIADSSEYSLLISPYEPLTVLRIKQGRLAILDLHGPGTDPRAPVAPPAAGLTGYNAISRHQLSPRFEAGWEAHGGQRWLGPPISEEFVELNAVDDRPVLVQYFMRGRLEYRPTPSGQAVPGAIGSELVAPRLAVREPAFLPVANPRDPTARYVAATGHTLRGPFLRFWEEPGVQQRLGNPISEPVIVTIADWTGLVQYFERARLDMRGGQVHVGSLGVELLVLRYGMP